MLVLQSLLNCLLLQIAYPFRPYLYIGTTPGNEFAVATYLERKYDRVQCHHVEKEDLDLVSTKNREISPVARNAEMFGSEQNKEMNITNKKMWLNFGHRPPPLSCPSTKPLAEEPPVGIEEPLRQGLLSEYRGDGRFQEGGVAAGLEKPRQTEEQDRLYDDALRAHGCKSRRAGRRSPRADGGPSVGFRRFTKTYMRFREYDLPYHMRVCIDEKLFVGRWYDIMGRDPLTNLPSIKPNTEKIDPPEPMVRRR